MSYLLCCVVKGSNFVFSMLDIISNSLYLHFSAMVIMVSCFLSSCPKGGDAVYNRGICAYVRLYIHMAISPVRPCTGPEPGFKGLELCLWELQGVNARPWGPGLEVQAAMSRPLGPGLEASGKSSEPPCGGPPAKPWGHPARLWGPQARFPSKP